MLLQSLRIAWVEVDALAIFKMNSQVNDCWEAFVERKVEQSPGSLIAADVAGHLVASDLVILISFL